MSEPVTVKKITRATRILPIVGLGVVLLGFVAKEIERDRYKEISDALHAAQGSYQFETQNQEMINFLKEMRQTHEQSAKPTAEQARLAAAQQYVMTAQQGIQRNLSDTKILIDAMPDSNGFKVHHKMISDDLMKVESHQMPSDAHNPAESATRLENELDELGPICQELDKLSKEVISMAEQSRENAESSYKTWTMVSYAAFGIGWFIALTGKLFGADVDIPGR